MIGLSKFIKRNLIRECNNNIPSNDLAKTSFFQITAELISQNFC
jgi:hypothetical protein